MERGYWYTEQEAVFMNREFNRRNIVLAEEPTDFVGGIPINGRSLQVRTRHPGAFANARITVGRFMFRDVHNRDHSMEFTYFGAGQEFQEGKVVALQQDNLLVPFTLDAGLSTFPSGDGNPSFEGSNSQSFTLAHEFNSLEYNYRVRRRMDRDHIALLPDGRWVRRATATNTREFLAGLRYFSSDEWMVWSAFGGRAGEMRIKANNDLIGGQLGGGFGWETDRWSLNMLGKAGVFVNFAELDRSTTLIDNDRATNTTTVVSTDVVNSSEETLAFVGGFSLTGRYHIRPNTSLRAGYELLYVDALAIAPLNITFTPHFKPIGLSGGNLYHGVFVGIDGYW